MATENSPLLDPSFDFHRGQKQEEEEEEENGDDYDSGDGPQGRNFSPEAWAAQLQQPNGNADGEGVEFFDISEYLTSIRIWISSAHVEGPRRNKFKILQRRDGLVLARPRAVSHSLKPEQLLAFPRNVVVEDDLLSGLRGLDACLLAASRGADADGSVGKSGNRQGKAAISAQVNHIVESTAKIPGLMKTIMLIEDSEIRAVVLRAPIMRRVMLSRYSIMTAEAIREEEEILRLRSSTGILRSSRRYVGKDNRSWVLEMLRSHKKRVHRIFVSYVQIVSDLTINDFLAFRDRENDDISEEDLNEFEATREALFSTLSGFRRILPYIASLSDGKIERSSVTAIIDRAIDDGISTPFSVINIFADFVSRFLLLWTHRNFLKWSIDESSNTHYQVPILVFTCIYLFYRIIIEQMALIRMSRKLFIMNLFNFWNVIDVASVVLAFWCDVVNIGYVLEPGADLSGTYVDLSAITQGLLWLSLVGSLKIINKDCAMFILAVTNILSGLRYFFILLVIFIVAFGDMVYTLFSVATEGCHVPYKQTSNRLMDWLYGDKLQVDSSDECPKLLKNYLRMFQILVGDVSTDGFETSSTDTALFVLFTFSSTVIVVNMLIAFAYDSYEQSAMQSARLFGRARVIQVAQTDAYEALLHPADDQWRTDFSDRLWTEITRLIFIGLQAALSYVVFRYFQLLYNGFHLHLVPLYIAFLGLQVNLVSIVYTGWRDDWKPRRWPILKKLQYNPLVMYLIFYPINWFVNRVMRGRRRRKGAITVEAAQKRNRLGDAFHKNGEWKKRLDYLKDRVRYAISESELTLRQELEDVEDRIDQLDLKLKAKAEAFRKSMEDRIDQAKEQTKRDRKEMLDSLEERVVKSILDIIPERKKRWG